MPGAAEERAATLEAAADLLTLAMRESHGPVSVLGSALERMAAALSHYSRSIERRRALEPRPPGGAGGHADAALGDLEACREALEREIAVCIESLQFHDRLMQRLTRVGHCLTGLTDGSRGSADPRRVNLSEGSIELF